MSAKRLPQLVILTFDDSVNDLNKGLYQVSAINCQTHNMFYNQSLIQLNFSYYASLVDAA